MTGRGKMAGVLAAAIALAISAASSPCAGEDRPGILSGIPSLKPGAISLGSHVGISAETVSYDENTGVALAEGNVEVEFGGRTIRADRIRYDSRSGEAEFAGHVHFKENGDEFSFDRIVLNLKTELGALYNGWIRISSNNYQISSEKFEKTGTRSFFIRKGELTTCPCDGEPDWKFRVGRSNVTIDGYATGRDVTFNIKGVPVLWLPWAAFPVKITRQSGLLLPTLTKSSTKGYSIELPYYWAINRWSDATITLDAMTRRGFRPEAEYRFVLNNVSEGAARGSVYYDKIARETRYRFYGENKFRYSEDWSSNARWDIASDDAYYEDLVDTTILRTARHIPSRGFAARRGSNDTQALSVVWVEDIQGTFDDNTVQRLPEYTATVLPRSLGATGVDGGGEFQATYFYRRSGDREVRGRGNAELYRAFSPYPSVSFTPYLSMDFLGSLPTSDVTGTRNSGRVVPNGGAIAEMDWQKKFDPEGGSRLIHVVSPIVAFRWVPDIDQDDITITDQYSRVGRQKQFMVSLIQRLFRVGKSGPAEIALLDISWAFEAGERNPSPSPYVDPLSPFVRTFRDQIDIAAGRIFRRTESASDIYARFRVAPVPGWVFSGETLVDPNDGGITMSRASAEWEKNKQNRALVEYVKTKDLSEDLLGLLYIRPFRFFEFKTEMNYSLLNRTLNEGSATLTLYPRSDCWGVGFVVSRKTNPDETSFRLTFTLSGIGSIGM